MSFEATKVGDSVLKDTVFLTLFTFKTDLIRRNGETERANSQQAENFKALDGSECPHKWSDNAWWSGTVR